MIVVSPSSRPFDVVDKVGVAIAAMDDCQLHSAFLFRIDDEPVHFLHLAWHHFLCCASEGQRFGPDESYMWADIPELDQENRRAFAWFLAMIGSTRSPVPYGFKSEGIEFDVDTGRLRPHPEAKGVTCATFLLAVLRSYALFPIKPDTWPIDRPGDTEWQLKIVQELSARAPEHAAAVENDLPCARFRPEEVVGASAIDGWPHEFREAELAGSEVLTDLRAAGRLA